MSQIWWREHGASLEVIGSGTLVGWPLSFPISCHNSLCDLVLHQKWLCIWVWEKAGRGGVGWLPYDSTMFPLWLWKSMLDNSFSLHQSFKGSSCPWTIFLSKVSSDCFSWVYKKERSSLVIFWFPMAKLDLISHDSKRKFVEIFKPTTLVCGVSHEPQEQPTRTLTTNVDPLLPSCVCSLLLQESWCT